MKLKRSIIKATQYFIGDLWKSKDGSVQMNLSGAKANSALNFDADKQAYYPSNIEDISFEFRDIEAGTEQIYTLDVKASFAYTILSVVLQCDNTISGIAIKVNGVAVSGMSALSANTNAIESPPSSVCGVDTRLS